MCLSAPDRNDSESRMEKIVPLTLAQDPDIICLNEVYDEGARYVATNLYKGHGYNVISRSTHMLEGVGYKSNHLEDSGLLLASKHKINWSQFRPFSYCEGDNCLEWQGIVGAVIDLSKLEKGQSIFIFLTHLNVETSLSGEKYNPTTRALQFDDIGSFVDEQEHDAAVLVGSLNVAESNKEDYSAMLRALGFDGNPAKDVFREQYASVDEAPGFTVDSTKNNLVSGNIQSRLDYILDLDGNSGPREGEVIPFGTDKSSQLSDHFAITMTIDSEGKNNKGKSTVPSSGCCIIQ